MKRNKNGFTLIELLAVVTILAILLLIVTPSVTGIIWNSKKDTFTSSVKNIGRSIEQVMLEDSSIVCDGREYDIQMLEMSNLSRFTGTWSCTNKNEEFVYTFTVTDGEFYAQITSGELIDGNIDVGDYVGPTMNFLSTLVNNYNIGDVISLSINDVIANNALGITFDIYEDGILLASNLDDFTYSVDKVVTLQVKYTATNVNQSITLTRTITINGNSLSDELLDDLVENGDGLQDFGDDSYRYVGDIEDNYVWYSGYLWRIVGLDGDSIKLVTDENVTTLAYNKVKENSAYYEDSYAQQWLDQLFLPTLNNYSLVSQKGNVCIDTAYSITEDKTTCTNELIVNLGLLTLYEYNFSGGEEGFLNNGEIFYTLTPMASNQSLYTVGYDGKVTEETYSVNNYIGLRPTIMLDDNIEYTSGDGTKENPYMLDGDNKADVNDYLVDRNSGEYLEINGNLWRIVSSDSQGTKIVLNSLYTDSTGTIQKYSWGNLGEYSVNSGIGQIMNTEVYNALFTTSDKSLLNTNAIWYMNEFINATDAKTETMINPLLTLADKSDGFSATVGLLNVGEVFATQTVDTEVSYYWLFSKRYNSTTESWNKWYLHTTGTAITTTTTTGSLAVRPAVYISQSVKILSGEGTISNPYKIN